MITSEEELLVHPFLGGLGNLCVRLVPRCFQWNSFQVAVSRKSALTPTLSPEERETDHDALRNT